MLQALLHKKLKASFADPTFKPSEDTLTSSVIGLLQYLPSDILANILRGACGISSSFPRELGDVSDIRFWEHWDGRHNTTNARLVEPDVLIITGHYSIIIEVKRSDDCGQYLEQWTNEIIAYRNSYPDDKREVVLFALGGNTSLKEQTLRVGKDRITVYRGSWFNLLHAVAKELTVQHPPHIKRLLSDIIDAFETHGFFDIEWINTLSRGYFSDHTVSVFTDTGTFSSLYSPVEPLNTTFLKL